MMKKLLNSILILFMISSLGASSVLKSVVMPGWGELNEYKILLKDENQNNISYIKDRSNTLMIAEGVIWLGFFFSNNFSSSYRDDYENYGTLYAGVDWSGKSDLFAAHVGNYNSIFEYNDFVRLISGSSENTYDDSDNTNVWDWDNDNSLRQKYDSMRNKSEQLDEFRTLMIAALAINRMASVFDVMSISRKHGRSFSFDVYDEEDEVGLKLNYNF